MAQRNVYTDGAHLAPALVTPAGGGTAVRLDTVTYQSAGNHQHPDATWAQETETGVPGFMTGEEKNKLSNVAAGSEANVFKISADANNALVPPTYHWLGTFTQYALLTPTNDTLYFVTGGVVTVAESMRLRIPIPTNADHLAIDPNYAGRIFRITDVRLLGGTAPTATVTLKINGVAVTGISVAAGTSYSVDSVATGNQDFTARQPIGVNIAGMTGAPTDVELTLHITKNII